MSDFFKGKDADLMALGWQRNQEGLYRKDDGEWMLPGAARVAAGLDAPPEVSAPSVAIEALHMYTTRMRFEGSGTHIQTLMHGTPTVAGNVSLPSGLTLTFDTPLSATEQEQLHALLANIAVRIKKELVS